MTSKKLIIVNADDLGMHPAIDAAVLRLVECRLVTSASIMVWAKPDRITINALKEHHTDLGLHLDFTSTAANKRYGTSHNISSMIVSAYCRHMNISKIRAMIRDQLDRFCSATGDVPRFVDGHEHVHQLPIVRTALLDVLDEQKLTDQTFIRNPLSRRWRGPKAALIGMLGANDLERKMTRIGLRCNTDFFGVYDFRKEVDLAMLWRGWLSSLSGHGALAMCHPAAAASKTIGDTQAISFRLREFHFLSSPQFQNLLSEYGVVTATWQEALALH